MKRWISLLTALVLMLGILAGCVQEPAGGTTAQNQTNSPEQPDNTTGAPAAQQQKLTIVVTTALTGEYKQTGDLAICAANLAVQEINAAGGVNGQEVVVEYIDIGADQQSAVTAMQKAVNTSGVSAIVGYYSSPYQLAFSSIIEDAKIPEFNLGNSSEVSALANPYAWQVRTNDVYSTYALAVLALDKYQMKNPAVIRMSDASGTSQLEALQDKLKERGVPIAAEFAYDSATISDFTPIVTQLKNTEHDGLIIISPGDNASTLLIKCLHEQGYDKPTVASSSTFHANVLAQTGEAFDGYEGVGEFSADMEDAQVQAYVEAMKASPDFPAGENCAWTDVVIYDAVKLICEAARLAGGNDPESINRGLAMIKGFDGVMSNYSFHDDHTFADDLYICKVEGDKIIFTETIDPRA